MVGPFARFRDQRSRLYEDDRVNMSEKGRSSGVAGIDMLVELIDRAALLFGRMYRRNFRNYKGLAN